MAGEISQAVIRGVFVHFRKRRVVEYEVNEQIKRPSRFKDHHSQVNELGGVFADDVHAEQLAVAAAK